jgi:hypothetical protein
MLKHHERPTLGDIRSAFFEGKTAAEKGEPVSLNPYPFDTDLPRARMHAHNQQHLAWVNGWTAGRRALAVHVNQEPMRDAA